MEATELECAHTHAHMHMQTHTPKAITTKHYIYTHFPQSRVARSVRQRQPETNQN